MRRWTTILTGGPGTGKTTTVARMLALLADQAAARGERISVALTAPTGKAASRLQEAVTAELAGLTGVPDAVALLGHPQGVTLHRLLGWRPDNATRFRHDRGNRLKYDVVVVDESLDGRADDDGAAARGAAARQPADPGRRPASS